MIKDKIRSRKGGSAIIFIMIAIFIVFIGTLPSLLDNSYMHIASKKLKTHANAAANSSCIILPNIDNAGVVTYDLVAGATSMKTYFETLFGETFTLVTTPISTADYYSATYKNSTNTISFQYVGYNKAVATKEPQASIVSPSIKIDSKGNSLDVSQIVNTVTVKKSSAIILIRYDLKSYLKGTTTSMVRYGASQVNMK